MHEQCLDDTLFAVVIDKESGQILCAHQRPPFDHPTITNLQELSAFWRTHLDTQSEPLLHCIDTYIATRTATPKSIIYKITRQPFLIKYIHNFQEQSIKDPLTQAYTKSYALELLHTLVMQYLRYKDKKFSVMMLDLDHFKKINDTYGHLCGDMVLKKVAEIIHHTLRHSDVFARFGGEEFTIILPNTTMVGAIRLAERIRQTIANTHFSCQGKSFPVTISIGITSVSINDSVYSLIERADEALYEAKRGGRNRIEYQ